MGDERGGWYGQGQNEVGPSGDLRVPNNTWGLEGLKAMTDIASKCCFCMYLTIRGDFMV